MTALDLNTIDLTVLPTDALIELARALDAHPSTQRTVGEIAALNAVFTEIQESRGVGLCLTHTMPLVNPDHCHTCLSELATLNAVRHGLSDQTRPPGQVLGQIEGMIRRHRQIRR